MAAITATAVGNANIEAKRIVVDMSETIAYLQPSATPLTVLTKRLNTQSCAHPKYEWMDNNTEVRWTLTTATAASTATSIAVTTGTGVNFSADDIIKDVTTGEVMKVSSISTDTLTVSRGLENAGTGTAVGSGDKILLIGNSAMQGSGAPAEKILGVTPAYNYTQIFKTAFSVTNTLDATKLYGPKELARLRKDAGIRHAKNMEYAFLFGAKTNNVSGAQPVTTTEGVMTTLASNANNVSKATGAVVEKDLLTFCESLFTYGGSERTCLCSPNILSWFAGLASTKVQLIQSDKDSTFGVNITKYMTPFGVLNLVLHPLLVQGYTGKLVALSMEDLYYRPLAGRDTKMMTNVQLPDEDGIRDMYITEAGVELRLPLKHGIFTITA